jgi:hypothetical protein
MIKTKQILATTAALLALAGIANAAVPPNGAYLIVNRATGKLLDTYASTVNGAPARQYDKSWGPAQLWTLSSGSGYWKLNAPANIGVAMYLDSLGHTGNGSDCNLWSNSGSSNQRWVIEDLGTGYYKIRNAANGLYLDNFGSTANGATNKFWASSGSWNQQWAFVAPGATFYADRSYAGTASQEFGIGTYNTSQMVAKGSADNSADSCRIWWPGFSALCYNSGDLSGTPVIFTENSQTMPGMAGIMSSVRIQAGYPSGITYRTASGGLEEFRPGFLFGTWVFMHRGDWAQLKSSGASKYTVRYETEYWVKSGVINYPLIEVLSGTNVRYATNGGSDPGTCTGTPLPWEEYWNLNGEVRWTNVEGNCAMNIAIRDGGP